MIKKIAITPNKCTGCSTCALTCAITYSDSFDLHKSYIKITKDDFNGSFVISYSSDCRNCCKCATVCPFQCLTVVEAGENTAEEAN